MQNDLTTHRNSQLSVLAQRRANTTVKPFIGALPGWNVKAARLRALAGSFYSTDEDKVLARLESGALLAEVRRRHTELQAAIKGEPSHSRLNDVDSAFQRLIDQLKMISARGSTGSMHMRSSHSATSGVHQQDEQN